MFKQKLLRLLPLLFLAAILASFFYFRWYEYLSFNTLQMHREWLVQWTAQHYSLAVAIFMATYILAVAISIPGAIILTLTGGFLFGIPAGTLYVTISATLGACLLFLAVKTALGQWLANKAQGWTGRMQTGFQENAFSYLLVLRLVPLFPFWAINIVAALLNVPLKTFFLATFFGIIPGTFVYITVGNGLSTLFAAGTTPNLGIIFQPAILLPLLGLALLSLLPVLYKRYQKRRQHH